MSPSSEFFRSIEVARIWLYVAGKILGNTAPSAFSFVSCSSDGWRKIRTLVDLYRFFGCHPCQFALWSNPARL